MHGAVFGLGQTPVSTQFADERIEISPAEDLEVLVCERFDMTQQCVLTAQKSKLGCIQSSLAHRAALFCSVETPVLLEFCVQFLEPQHRKDMHLLGASPEEDHEDG